MAYNRNPLFKKQKANKQRATANGYERLPDTWRYGKKSKAQWKQAFEEEAMH
jgi:hypothetical protein